jgi:hypothetical protein
LKHNNFGLRETNMTAVDQAKGAVTEAARHPLKTIGGGLRFAMKGALVAGLAAVAINVFAAAAPVAAAGAASAASAQAAGSSVVELGKTFFSDTMAKIPTARLGFSEMLTGAAKFIAPSP